jgi:hypothetical protein
MSAPSQRIQVIADENVYRILTEMGQAGLRGKSRSEVAYKILEEWIWNNQEKLRDNGIHLSKKER